jgi:hypothetical protein
LLRLSCPGGPLGVADDVQADKASSDSKMATLRMIGILDVVNRNVTTHEKLRRRKAAIQSQALPRSDQVATRSLMISNVVSQRRGTISVGRPAP